MLQQHELEKKLYEHFGYENFREGQQEIIQSVISGKHTLATLPTGSGKSICYQLPALITPGLTIVISPLISLMIDQVKWLKMHHIKSVEAINSFISPKEKEEILMNLYQLDILYCSPEMLQQEKVMNRLKSIHINYLVIDEAHCISQWGHEFRTDYLRLKDSIKILDNPTVLALSATATPDIQLDIQDQLNVDLEMLINPMDRENISMLVEVVDSDSVKKRILLDTLQSFKVPTMIYFSSRSQAEKVSHLLNEKLPDREISYYHGGMEQRDRLQIQQQFMNDQLDIICCTSAFGMGINKDNIRLIIHYHMPSTVESFIQEVGRAGRDHLHSVSLLLYRPGDENISYRLLESELPTHQEIKKAVDGYIGGDKDFSSLTETQARFLEYQLTHRTDGKQLMIEKIINSRDKRIMVKYKSVQQMLNWVFSENCRREELYSIFQSHIKPTSFPCCEHCGFQLEEWTPEQTLYENRSIDWKEQLKVIFRQR
ncbi:ATP-dependent DNA helicase [Halalkalibacillus sediminis]|uniref:ATP-dependent DNA helicase n=1 Tax=Halalkalibacillus sediminis TaxID=2018042 RepID=A0A2I0QX02_9BACI|nr:RecQ family ATP-dependent DNA helicase [Halalkalibacillus sediminis]PKR78877.1 ATP-dependent DNA helicase [Halalkalibacillus sediminis]